MDSSQANPAGSAAGRTDGNAPLLPEQFTDSARHAAGSSGFMELVHRRYSVRSFLDKPVEEEKLAFILEAAASAPSACNNQPWIFIVIRDSDNRARLETVYNRPWFLQAPIIIAACYDTGVSWRRGDGKDYGDVDTAIAVDHLTLAAAELGLGTCWVGAFNVKAARAVLMLPKSVEPLAFIPLGYPASGQPKKVRKPLEEIVYREFFRT